MMVSVDLLYYLSIKRSHIKCYWTDKHSCSILKVITPAGKRLIYTTNKTLLQDSAALWRTLYLSPQSFLEYFR